MSDGFDHILDQPLSHILSAIQRFQSPSPQPNRPFVLGITGLQGSGKSTWASTLASALRSRGRKVLAVSLDDFYHRHENLVRLRDENPSNKLLRTRGQPGTHETKLAEEFFRKLRGDQRQEEDGSGGGVDDAEIAVPSFDKSAFNGEGDRVPASEWECVSVNPPVEVVIFEGWCVGFRPLDRTEVEQRWRAAQEAAAKDESTENEGASSSYTTRTLQWHLLEHLQTVNQNLRAYCETFMGPSHFDYLLHLDTDDLVNVYKWRIGQEHALRKAKGKGMTDEEVVKFVQGYMPSYELYLNGLREKPFIPKASDGNENHLRIVLDIDRAITRTDKL